MGNTIEQVRNRYAGMNKLPFQQRINISKCIEQWTIDTMNYHGVKIDDTILNNWIPTSDRDDQTFKRDAETTYQSKKIYSQIKFRQPDSGTDIGIAIYQPYFGLNEIKELMRKKDQRTYQARKARDYKFDGYFYCCLDNSWDYLAVLPYKKAVSPMITKILTEWLNDKNNVDLDSTYRTYPSQIFPGAELKWKRDGGRGWDQSTDKIICYLPITLFTKNPDAQVIKMIDPPDYVLNP